MRKNNKKPFWHALVFGIPRCCLGLGFFKTCLCYKAISVVYFASGVHKTRDWWRPRCYCVVIVRTRWHHPETTQLHSTPRNFKCMSKQVGKNRSMFFNFDLKVGPKINLLQPCEQKVTRSWPENGNSQFQKFSHQMPIIVPLCQSAWLLSTLKPFIKVARKSFIRKIVYWSASRIAAR